MCLTIYLPIHEYQVQQRLKICFEGRYSLWKFRVCQFQENNLKNLMTHPARVNFHLTIMFMLLPPLGPSFASSTAAFDSQHDHI